MSAYISEMKLVAQKVVRTVLLGPYGWLTLTLPGVCSVIPIH